jgi:uncharacterized protein
MSEDILPIFPLNTVLLPGVALPLHIFEERYRTMVAACLAQSGRFGVVLIASGNEVGAPATPFSVGTTARIAGVDRLEDGRMNIVCVGEQRFRIQELVPGAAYQQARVHYWPDAAEDCDQSTLAAEVRSALEGFLATVATGAGREAVSFPTAPAELGNALAASLPIDAAERQALLEMPGTCSRLRRVLALLNNEALMLRAFGGARFIAERPSRFSSN